MRDPRATARPLRPTTVAAADWLVPWLIVAAGALAALASTAVWVTAGLLHHLVEGSWPKVGWSITLVARASGLGDWPWGPLTPRTVQLASAVLLAVLLVPAGIAAVRVVERMPRSDSHHRALGQPSHVTALQLPAQRRAALRLRRDTLVGRQPGSVGPAEVGLALGRVDTGRGPGPQVFAGWEDVVLAVMAPRSGKTTALAIPAILSAPGAVVATSNKLDVLHTAGLRRERSGLDPWVFDPQQIARTAQTWWWDPLAGITTVEQAEQLAGHFVTTVADERASIWPMSATSLLTALILAATLTGQDITQVYVWLANEADPTPQHHLQAAGYTVLASMLRGLTTAAPETRASVYFTARSGAACLTNPQITAWVTPNAGTRFDPARFIAGPGTLYLLSKDSGASAAPLVAALADRVLREGERAAEARGGRLDPPLVVVLDEAASVAPIRELPKLYSHYGSRGILPITILQSLSQGEAVWGRGGMDALWSSATIKVIGSGIDSEDVATRISRLIGEQDVATVSVTSGRSGSRSTSLTSRPVLTAAQVRALPKGTALLFATGARPVTLQLAPYYRGPDAAAVTAHAEAITAHIAAEAHR